MRSLLLCMLTCLTSLAPALGQHLKPGFDKAEYIELLELSARQGSAEFAGNIPAPQHAKMIYRSEVVGLENRWDLWMRDDHVAIISLRGTTASQVSWLANFYAAMVPAVGELQISKTETFRYHLADNPKAGVHIGWLLSTAYLSKDITPKLDSLCAHGIRDVIVMGHSQGGAIAYLMTAYLYRLQKVGKLPADLRIKTYCSAGPKPGNLFFAYDYETMTRDGWAYNVVSSADWVPETPVSIQTLSDFNTTNIFSVAPELIRKQKFPVRWIGKYVFNRLSKPTIRAQRKYEKYLGRMVSKPVVKHLPEYMPPDYLHSTHFVRTGNYIVLQANENYYKLYHDSKENPFVHHMFQPYLYLAKQLPDSLSR